MMWEILVDETLLPIGGEL